MNYYKYCSQCGETNTHGYIDGNHRYHCTHCKAIHYQNPKPTATLICPKGDHLLLGRRAFSPGKGEWGLPGGFMELNETLYDAALRELKEETNLEGKVTRILGTCSHYGSIFGDILLIGLQVDIDNWDAMIAGDDVSELKLFSINNLPDLAFDCHTKILSYYLK
ncbi:MAG: hypothetical protein CMG46_00110 [Candidatus Marinimicrobia bacterium]|nr:hypothetical protein [Candidatus Neomarinimicrobiota bacterium]|tara:strand:- start:72 stop:563 length:492 start_codon:yes stop_codon:yes gene_type:complete